MRFEEMEHRNCLNSQFPYMTWEMLFALLGYNKMMTMMVVVIYLQDQFISD